MALSVSATRRMTYAEALVDGIACEMRSDPNVFLIGQDIGPFGGAMSGARGLYEEFGPRRVRDAPISESAMVGAGVGAALFGRRPIVEVSFGEFLPCAMNQLVLQAPNLHYMTAGRANVPLVVRTRVGDGPYRGHPQSYESWFAHVPGWKVVMPAFPSDAKGLMIAAIRDPNPVLVFEPMSLYHGVREDVADGAYEVPIGPARVVYAGTDVTLAATGWLVHRALSVAEELIEEGISVEVIDVRTLAPLDTATLVESVGRTGRLVVAHEAWRVGGIGAEIAASVADEAFASLRAPIKRVGAKHVPIPSAASLRELALPTDEDLRAAVREVVHYAR
jgi:acetoin:2,6-dichlorophenolindophenol oxidoreductase subunit beta